MTYDSLVAQLHSDRWRDRRDAAQALATASDPRAVDTLIASLDDAHEEVRAEAAQALGEIRDDRSIAPLSRLLVDRSEDFSVRRCALLALRDVGSNGAVALVDLLRDTQHDVALREEAALALGTMWGGNVGSALIAALDDPARRVRRSAESALVAAGEPARPLVVEAAGGSNRAVAAAAARLLKRLDKPPDATS